MNDLNRKFVDDEGREETVIASSSDNYDVKLDGGFSLANHNEKKQNKLVKKFKGTILGADIGVKSGGFTSMAILATVIAIAAFVIMYFIWRF